MKERASCEPETAEYLRETDNTPAKKKPDALRYLVS